MFDQSNNTGAIDVRMNGSVLEEESSFKILGLSFSSKMDWGFYKFSIAKIGALIRSIMAYSKTGHGFVKFLSPEGALYLYKSTIRACIGYYRHVLAGAPSCYLELLYKLQSGYVGLLVLHMLPLLNPWFIVQM